MGLKATRGYRYYGMLWCAVSVQQPPAVKTATFEGFGLYRRVDEPPHLNRRSRQLQVSEGVFSSIQQTEIYF
jgi:hypothetical protein